MFDCNMSNAAMVLALKRARAEIGVKLAKMLTTCFAAACIGRELGWITSDLRRDEGQHVGWRRFFRAERPAGKSQVGEMNGKPEPIGRAPSLANQRQIFRRVGVMPHDHRGLRRRIEQRRA